MNGLMYRLSLIAIVLLCSAASGAAKDWRGILPLHSTRADVERLLGPPPDPTSPPRYSLDEGEVHIVFADKSGPASRCPLAVAEGTVLLIQVTPKGGMLIKDLDLQRGFRKFNPSSLKESEYEGFVNEEDGLVIRAHKGVVDLMVYVASAADRPRCPDYYGKDLGSFVSVFFCGYVGKFDGYGDQPFEDEKARLDNFAINILNIPDATGHVIVYAGRKALVAEAQLRGNRIRDYLLYVRQLDSKRLTVVDGGHRESAGVELYIVPAGVPGPEPSPDVQAKDVEIIYEKPKRRGRKNR